MVIKLDKQMLRSFVEFFPFVTPQIKSLAEIKTDKTGENTPNGLSDDAIYKFNYYAIFRSSAFSENKGRVI